MNAAISFTGGSPGAGNDGVVGTVNLNAGELRLCASTTSPTVLGGPNLSQLSLSLSVEKPGSFIVDCDVPNRDVRFQFMNRVSVMERPLSLTYTHATRARATAVDASLAVNAANKVWASYAFDSGACKLKYSYVHGGVRTFEPCYDVASNSWDVSVSQRILDGDVVRAFYRTSGRLLGMELLWQGLNRDGRFKITACMNLDEGLKIPKLSAESTWNFEM